MRVADALDTAPLIYYIEEHPAYISIMTDVLEMVTKRDITIVTSVITLAEVLVKPFEARNTELAKSYRAILSNAENTELHAIGMDVAEHAASLRAELGLRTPDALHVATAIRANCDALLTNDTGMKRAPHI